MADLLFGFVSALISVAVAGAAARWFARTCGVATGRTADGAAYCVAAGYFLGRTVGNHDSSILVTAGTMLGGGAAMYGLGVWLLKKPPEHQAADD